MSRRSAREKAGARIGLIGGNGAGKFTLLRILAGSEEVDGGEVTRRRMQLVLERHGRLLRRFTELGGPGFEGEVRSGLRALGLDETLLCGKRRQSRQ